MKNAIIAVLVAIIAVGGAITFAQPEYQSYSRVGVTVWQHKTNGKLYVSTKVVGQPWATHPEALDMSASSSSGTYWQSNAIQIYTPVPTVPSRVYDAAGTYWRTGGIQWNDDGGRPDPVTGGKRLFCRIRVNQYDANGDFTDEWFWVNVHRPNEVYYPPYPDWEELCRDRAGGR